MKTAEDIDIFRQNVVIILRRSGQSQAELARKIGMSDSLLGKYLGTSKTESSPGLKVMRKIADGLRTQLKDLLDPKTPEKITSWSLTPKEAIEVIKRSLDAVLKIPEDMLRDLASLDSTELSGVRHYVRGIVAMRDNAINASIDRGESESQP